MVLPVEVVGGDGGADALGHRVRVSQRRARQEERQLLAAVARRQVDAAEQQLAPPPGDLAQRAVADEVALGRS